MLLFKLLYINYLNQYIHFRIPQGPKTGIADEKSPKFAQEPILNFSLCNPQYSNYSKRKAYCQEPFTGSSVEMIHQATV